MLLLPECLGEAGEVEGMALHDMGETVWVEDDARVSHVEEEVGEKQESSGTAQRDKRNPVDLINSGLGLARRAAMPDKRCIWRQLRWKARRPSSSTVQDIREGSLLGISKSAMSTGSA